MEAKIYNQKGEETGKLELPENVFGVSWNGDLVHQVVSSMMSNQRFNIADTKGRGEVSGGGKKPWKQKGTGRARHGSSRSPIWRGGGITFGPTSEKNYDKKVNKKSKAKALYTVLSKKMRDGEIIFVDGIKLPEIKTKQAKEVLVSLSKLPGFDKLLAKRKNSAYIALGDRDENAEKSFDNFGNVKMEEIRNINPLDILNFKYLIITEPKESVAFISNKLA